MKSILFVCLLTLLSFKSFPDSTKVQPPKPQATVVQATPQKSEEKISAEAYKLLYEEMKGANDRILSTVYWALGTIVGIAVAVIFLNYRFSDREIQNIRTELLNQLEQTRNTFHNELTTRIETERTALRTTMDENQKAVVRIIKRHVKAFEEDRVEKFAAFTTEYEEKLAAVERSKKIIEGNYHDTKAKFYEVKEWWSFAIGEYLAEIKINIEMESAWSSEYPLKSILACLQQVNEVYETDMASLESVLDTCEKEERLVDTITEIRKLLETTKLKENTFMRKTFGYQGYQYYKNKSKAESIPKPKLTYKPKPS